MTGTIRDVARRLNLSITTVSRALDGYDDVAESTRQLVVRVANEMGYVPNRAARQLRRRQADTIGYILPAAQPRMNEPFYSEFVAGIGDEAAQHNIDLLVSLSAPNSQAEREVYARWVHGHRVDGLVIHRTRLDDWRMNFMSEAQMPFVAVERPQNVPETARAAFVEIESFSAFKHIVQHLAERGHRRIAYIGGPGILKLSDDRLRGFRAGLAEAGLAFEPHLALESNLNSASGYEQAQLLLNQDPRPSALVCVNDTIALGAANAAIHNGLRIGQDIAISGFDGLLETEQHQPPLTTFKQPLYQTARQLVQLLLGLIADPQQGQSVIRLEAELAVRASTDYYLKS